MVQHADGVDEIKTLESEWRVVQVCLYDVNIARLRISSRDFDGRAEIDGPDFGAVLRGVIGEASVAATRVEDLLAGEEVCGVWLHVVEKLLLPLVVHLRELMPLVTESSCCFGLRCFVSSRSTFAGECVTHRREQETWYAVNDWEGEVATSAVESAVRRRQARATIRAAQSFQQRLYSVDHC